MSKEINQEHNRTIWDSIGSAIVGWNDAYSSDKKYLLYFKIIVVFTILNILSGVQFIGWIVFFINSIGVFAAEVTNSVIEDIADFLTMERDERIRKIKDMGSTPVLIWTISYYTCEFIFIGIGIYNKLLTSGVIAK